MSHVVEFLKEQVADHQRHLQESDEDAHTHVLILRQLEYKQKFIKEHFPDNAASREMLELIQKMRKLVPKALEHKT